MEEETKVEEAKTEEVAAESTSEGTVKQWIQDNLRVIISVLIVVAIAGGIYSYSKRTEAPTTTPDQQQTSDDQSQAADQQQAQGNDNSANTSADNSANQEKAAPAAAGSSQETETSFVETAGKGESATVLARRALANYLDKNQDSTLTAEHKIYIEDFLRKNAPHRRIFVGTSVEFSKTLIQNAITKAKNLNANQLKNLHKYAVRVPSLS